MIEVWIINAWIINAWIIEVGLYCGIHRLYILDFMLIAERSEAERGLVIMT